MKYYKKIIISALILTLTLTGCSFRRNQEEATEVILYESSGTDAYYDINENINDPSTGTTSDAEIETTISEEESLFSASDYVEDAYIVINNDTPYFTEDELGTECYRNYGNLDALGRTQYSIMITCKEELPEGERGEIGHIKPSGWNQAKYEGVVDSDPPYLYNRCHLLMWALIGDESNVQENLITGTRFFNTEGMLPNEMEVLNYVKNSENHVIYRVTPYYNGDNLLAEGVLIEAMSVEDKGESLSLCRWVYNVQPGVTIEYSDGSSYLTEE